MKRITATTLSRNLLDILDKVEGSGETFVVMRRGREIDKLSPYGGANGQLIIDLLKRRPEMGDFLGDIRSVRALLVTVDRELPD